MNSWIYRARQRGLDVAHTLSWLPPLLLRISVGVTFAQAGWGKLQHLDRVIGFFDSLGIPLPGVQAPMVATFELACGLLLIGGLLTRLASLPLMAIMAVALLTTKVGDLEGLTDLFFVPEYLTLLGLLWLAVAGAGAKSLDALAVRRGLAPWAAASSRHSIG